MLARPELVSLLRGRGFLSTSQEPDETALEIATARAAMWLVGTADVGPLTVADMLREPACGFPDAIMVGPNSLWGPRTARPVALWLDPNLPSLSAATWRSLVREACDRVSAICALTFQIVDDRRTAAHLITPARIDGPLRILADCQLPTGIELSQPTIMRIDVAEGWVSDRRSRMINALDVLVHEGGHRDGLPHVPASEALCIMNPLLNPSLLGVLQPRDALEYVNRYGQKPTAPPASPVARSVILTGGSVTLTTPAGTQQLELGNSARISLGCSAGVRIEIPNFRITPLG